MARAHRWDALGNRRRSRRPTSSSPPKSPATSPQKCSPSPAASQSPKPNAGYRGPTFKSVESSFVQCPTANDEQNAEDQKPDVPRKRPTKIVPHMMDAKYLVVDQSLDDVEDAPAGQDEPEVEPPVRCQASLPPSLDRGDGSDQDKNPSRQMKEPVCQRVDIQPGDGVHRVAAHIAYH